ncbi:hypothetical protein T265_13938, partial [Opisthorchis viverrini]
MLRKRSISMGSVRYRVAGDETCTAASSSSKRTTEHQKSKEDEDVDQEVEGQKEDEVATERKPKLSNAQSVDQLIVERDISEGKKQTFYGAAVYQTSVFGRSSRSGSILASYNLSRRGSASLPEQISSAHFSGRLSEVGDELEESIQIRGQWLERRSTDLRVRGSNPTVASRLSLSRVRLPGSILALVFTFGAMAVRHRKDATAEGLFVVTNKPLSHGPDPSTGSVHVDKAARQPTCQKGFGASSYLHLEPGILGRVPDIRSTNHIHSTADTSTVDSGDY